MNAKDMVQQLRERFSETELADKLGCDRSTVNRWLNGKNHPTGPVALKVAELHRSEVRGNAA